MNWRQFFEKNQTAIALENRLSFTLVEHNGGINSTANTNIERKIINLDTSQDPLKVALSYCYELMNVSNLLKYNSIILQAKNNQIKAVDYVNSITKIEAEAAIFRCEAFFSFNQPNESYPGNPKFLEIYEKVKNKPQDEKIKAFQRYILDEGVVRKKFSAKAYYLDAYRYYAGKKAWPEKYDAVELKQTYILKNNNAI
jgi:hypothetical protein